MRSRMTAAAGAAAHFGDAGHRRRVKDGWRPKPTKTAPVPAVVETPPVPADGGASETKITEPPPSSLDTMREQALNALRDAAAELGRTPTSSWWQQNGRVPRYAEIVAVAGPGWADAIAAAGLRSESEGEEPQRCVVVLP